MKMMMNKLKEKIKELAETGLYHQNSDGGIPVFPGTLLDNGLIATAELLYSILEYKEYFDFSENIKKHSDSRMHNYDYEPMRKSVRKGLEFLLENQSDNGGFPPLADVFWITKDFTEATASAILTLSKGLKNLDVLLELKEDGSKVGWEKRIKDPLERSYARLLDTRRENKEECYWNTGEDPEFGEKRLFSTIMAGKALNEYLDLVRRKSIEDKFDYGSVIKIRNKVAKLLMGLIKQKVLSHDIESTEKAKEVVRALKDYSGPVVLPEETKKFTPSYGDSRFAIDGKIFHGDFINFSNMAFAIAFLYESQKVDKNFPISKEEVEELCWPVERILEKHILNEEYSFKNIDIDEINLKSLKDEMALPYYGYERPQKLSAMLMEKTVKGRLFDDWEYGRYCENLFSHLKDKNYCQVFRGGTPVPSTLATAYAIRCLGEFARQTDKVNSLFKKE